MAVGDGVSDGVGVGVRSGVGVGVAVAVAVGVGDGDDVGVCVGVGVGVGGGEGVNKAPPLSKMDDPSSAPKYGSRDVCLRHPVNASSIKIVIMHFRRVIYVFSKHNLFQRLSASAELYIHWHLLQR